MSNWPATGTYTMNWCRICPGSKSRFNKNGKYDLNDVRVQRYLDGHGEDQLVLFVTGTQAALYWVSKREGEVWYSTRPGQAVAPIQVGELGDTDEFESDGGYERIDAMMTELVGEPRTPIVLSQMQELLNAVGISEDAEDLTKCLYDKDEGDDLEESITPDDIARMISEEGGGFKITRIYTDKFINDEGFGAGEIFNMIEESKQPGVNVSYIEGDTFASHASAPQPEVVGALSDKDEFSRDDLCSVLVFYTGTASEEELVKTLIQEFKVSWGMGDDWLDVLVWH